MQGGANIECWVWGGAEVGSCDINIIMDFTNYFLDFSGIVAMVEGQNPFIKITT